MECVVQSHGCEAKDTITNGPCQALNRVYVVRHSFASALRRAGTDLADIQYLLGHADPGTSEIYAPPVSAKHYEAIARLSASGLL